MTRSVGALDAVSLTFRIVVRQLVTRGRLIALVLLGGIVVVVAAAVGANALPGEELTDAVSVIANVVFTILVPLVALVFASASLGDLREDRTLVYLWLRPMDRWPVVVGAWAAAVTISIPLTVISAGAAAVATGGGSDVVVATIIATVVAVAAYAALFVLLGLLLKNSIVWGLGYVLLWEGLAAGVGTFAARLSIRGYARSILTDHTGVSLDSTDLTLIPGIVVPLLIAVGAIALATVRLDRLEVD